MSNYFSAAKLRAPKIGTVVGQERLQPLLGKPDSTHIWIQGPAGYGKSTLAAHFVHTSGMPHIWYRIDAGDGDLANLLDGIIAALRRNVNFPHGRMPPLQALLAGSADYAAAFFWRAAANHLPSPLVIVFDEVENMPIDAHGHCALAAACEELPDGISLLFLSRNEPPPALARLVVNQRLHRIGPETLRLTKAETAALLAQHDRSAEPTIVDAVESATHGWPAAVSLLARHGTDTDLLPADTLTEIATLCAYVEAEVMREVPARLHNDLALVALTDTVSVVSAQSLTGSDAILDQLEAMADQRLFVTRLEGAQTAYQLHPIVRDFLRKKLKQSRSADDHAVLLLKAAKLLLVKNALTEAVELMRQANAIDDICSAIETYGERLFADGHSETLRSWLALVPAATRSTRPWLLYWDACTLLMTDPGRARLLLGDAYQGFRASSDVSGRALAWAASVDALFIEYAAFADLDCWLECLESEVAPLLESLPPSVSAKVALAEFSALSFRRPDSPKLVEVRNELIRLIELSPDPDFVSRARGQLFIYALWHGDNIDAANQLESILEIARLPNSAPLRRLFAQVLELTHCTITADYDVSNAKIEACIGLADESGIHVWDGIIRGHRVCTLIAQGRYGEAASHLPAWRACLQNERQLHMSRYQAAAAYLGAKSQATTFARDFCAKALMSAERAGAPTLEMNTWIMVAATLIELDNADGDADALLQSVLTRTRNFNPQLHWVALLVSAGIAAQREDDAAAIALVEHAFRLGAERSYWHFANWPRELIGRACEVAIQHGIEPTYTTELIRRNDLQPSTAGFHLDAWPWRVKIRTLGRFAVFVDGEPVTFSSKAQKMPIRLLQAIVAHGGREVSETKLSDLLWPEAEGDAAATSLGVTLHRLRRLLQVECLTRQDGRLSLDGRLVWVDVWAFERALSDIGTIAQLSGAELRSLYQGDFLQELDNTPWAMPPRERLRDKLVRFIAARSKQLISEQRHADAEELLLAGLEIDDLVEGFYRALMRCQSARDDASAAMQTYNRCKRVLEARLLMKPSAMTNALRAELVPRRR